MKASDCRVEITRAGPTGDGEVTAIRISGPGRWRTCFTTEDEVRDLLDRASEFCSLDPHDPGRLPPDHALIEAACDWCGLDLEPDDPGPELPLA